MIGEEGGVRVCVCVCERERERVGEEQQPASVLLVAAG